MKKLKHLPTLIFLAFVFIMLALFWILPKKEYSSTEKRYLEPAPAFRFDALFSGKFGDDFETFLSDQFAGRNFWVGLNAYYNLAVGNNGASGIYHARDGYLVNDPTDDARFAVNLDVIEEFCEKHRDVPSTVLIAPSTGYICADVLPKNHLAYKDDALFTLIGEKIRSADFVDVRDRFRAAYAEGTQIYYKTDHHWTTAGAYEAYAALSEAMGFTPTEQGAFEKHSYPGFYGTTYSSSGFWLTKPDDIEVWENQEKTHHIAITDGGSVVESDSLFFPDHLDEDDKYPVFLDGNHPLTVITTPDAEKQEKLLLIKDSFAHSLTPFLADNYAEITMVDMRYFKQNVSELLEQEGFDRILFLYSVDNLATDGDIVWLE